MILLVKQNHITTYIRLDSQLKIQINNIYDMQLLLTFLLPLKIVNQICIHNKV